MAANLANQLQDSGFFFNSELSVWQHEVPDSFGYSDGDEHEVKIGRIISEAQDKSSQSDELHFRASDWTTRYHLSRTRTNVLKPFIENFRGKRVLEIGSGMGALTVFLAEYAEAVVSIEPSLRRATITANRVAHHENVVVVNSTIEKLNLKGEFDFIVVIGVLEYAARYSKQANSHQDMLDKCSSLCSQTGYLLLGIENQLGLKYFAGSPEDHTGHAYLGLENRYELASVRTFGRYELSSKLKRSGFENTELYMPFPDYKFPKAIVKSHKNSYGCLDLYSLIVRAYSGDSQLPNLSTFDSQRVLEVCVDNRILEELTNSFLYLASKMKPKYDDQQNLAWHFSSERYKDFVKTKSFKSVDNRTRCLIQRDSSALSQKSISSGQYVYSPKDEEYYYGPLYLKIFEDIFSNENWTIDELSNAVRDYLEKVMPQFINTDISRLNLESYIPGVWIDAMPWNVVIEDGSNQIRLFDQEWAEQNDIQLGYFIVRILLGLKDVVGSGLVHGLDYPLKSLDFIALVLAHLDPEVEEINLYAWLYQEYKFQSFVTKPSEDYESWLYELTNVTLGKLNVGKKLELVSAISDTLATENETLRLSINTLATENETLRLSINTLATENETLRLSINTLATENETLRLSINTLATENETLRLSINTLATENETLRLSNEVVGAKLAIILDSTYWRLGYGIRRIFALLRKDRSRVSRS